MTTTTTYVLDLRDAIDPREAGRKAATLAQLGRDGFPVPDGVVLIAEALDHALAEGGLAGEVSAEAVAGLDLPGGGRFGSAGGRATVGGPAAGRAVLRR
jgi:hypothetical protein